MNWIYTSDDLPDKQDEYLIAWKGKLGMTDSWSRPFYEIAEYEPMIEFLQGGEWDLEHIHKRGWTEVEVLAWMPLPEFEE